MNKFFKKIKGKLLRLWPKEEIGSEYDYVFIIDHFILPDKRVMIETRTFDERKPDKMYPYSHFYLLDEIILSYCEEDQEDI